MFRLLKTFSAFSSSSPSAYHVRRRISTNHHSTPSCSQISYVTTSRPFSSTPTPPPPPGTTDSTLFGRDSLKRAAAIIAPSVVHILLSDGSIGSGIIADSCGTIITCSHIVIDTKRLRDRAYSQSVKQVTVFLSDGSSYKGVVSKYKIDKDLALINLKLPSSVALHAAKWGIAKEVCLGDMVLSVGSTLGWAHSFSKGIVSCLKRTNKEVKAKGTNNLYIQTDCASLWGNSGGPIVNLSGEVIGMVVGGEPGRVGFALRLDSLFQILKTMGYKRPDSLSRQAK